MIGTRVIKKFKPFMLGFCACGCGTELESITYKWHPYLRTFIKGHQNRGILNKNWKGGNSKTGIGYIGTIVYDYYKKTTENRVKQHRFVYEQYYNCCLLPWTDIHHINEDKIDNRIENLRPMTRSQHIIHHRKLRKQEILQRECRKCGSHTTRQLKNGTFTWYKSENGFMCLRCYNKQIKRFKSKNMQLHSLV